MAKKIFILIMIFLFGCAPNHPNKDELLSKNVDFLIVKGNEFWEKRVNPENAKWARIFLHKSYQLRPKDKKTGLLYSRASFYEGKYIERNEERKDSLFLNGALTALSYLVNLELHQINSKTLLNTKGGNHFLFEKIENSNISSLPELYLLGLNLGYYILKKPVRKRMEQKDFLEVLFYKIYSLDPSYDFGGPLKLMGIFYSRIPGMDISQSKIYFDKAIKLFPYCYSHKTAKAEFYYIKSGHRESFNTELIGLIEGDPTIIPDIMSENLMEQERAQFLLDNESSYFE